MWKKNLDLTGFCKKNERTSLSKFQSLVRTAIYLQCLKLFVYRHMKFILQNSYDSIRYTAFRDFFNNENALVFRSGSSNGLVEHMQYVLDMNQNEYEQLKEKMVSLEYKEPWIYSPHNTRS